MLPIPTSCFLSDELEILIKAEPLIQGCLWVDDNFDVEGQEKAPSRTHTQPQLQPFTIQKVHNAIKGEWLK